MQYQGLTPGMQRGEDARLRAQVLRVRQQGAQRVPHGLKQQGRHHGDIGQPQRVEVMGQGEDHLIMVTRQEPRPLPRQPALGLEIRTLRTCPVAARVVPDTGDVAVRAGLHMAAQRGRPALHDGARSSADVGGQGMRLGIRGKSVLEDRLQGHEGHRGLRTSGIRASLGCFVQYHASYPRCKRLVQTGVIGNPNLSISSIPARCDSARCP